MREITPIERMMAMLEQQQRQIELMATELSAYLPDDGHPTQNWITDPLTGERRYIKGRTPY